MKEVVHRVTQCLQFSNMTKSSQFVKFGICWSTNTVLQFPARPYNAFFLRRVTQECVWYRYPRSWLLRINKCESMQPGCFWHGMHVIERWFCVLLPAMNCGIVTSPWCGKALELGIKKMSQHQKILSWLLDEKNSLRFIILGLSRHTVY